MIDVRGIKLGIWKQAMNDSQQIRIEYASKYSECSNYWKNSIGMPRYIVDRIQKVIGISNKSVKIAILGLSFKPGSDDVRDAPSAKIIARLIESGYTDVAGYDPVANDEFKAHYPLRITYYTDYAKLLEDADALIIATAWYRGSRNSPPECRCAGRSP